MQNKYSYDRTGAIVTTRTAALSFLRGTKKDAVADQKLCDTVGSLMVHRLSLLGSQVQGEPAAKLVELNQAFGRCSRVQRAPEVARGSVLRLRYSICRDGTLIGEPALTYVDARGGDATKAAFREVALRSFQACCPVANIDGLGAVAGRRRQATMTF